MTIHAPLASPLPVCAWQRTISYLTDEEGNVCIYVCKQLAIIVLCNPSGDLEAMDKRKTIPYSKLSPPEISGPTFGPTVCFLRYHPRPIDPRIRGIHQKIKEKRKEDPTIDQTVR